MLELFIFKLHHITVNGLLQDVALDIKLHFQLHILSLKKCVSRSVRILSKLRFLFPSSTLLLYHTLVHPHLTYGLPIWGCTFKTYLDKLQVLQNKAICIITYSDRRSSVTLWQPTSYVPQTLNNSLSMSYISIGKWNN